MRYLLGFSAVFGLMLCGCTPAPVAQSGGGGSSVTTDGGEAAVASSDPAEMPAGDSATTEATEGTPATTDPAPATGEPPATTEPAAAPATEAAAGTPVALADGVAVLSAENTKIQFTGTHSGDKPNPRVGGFGKFTGEAKVDPAAKTLQSVSIEIDTASLFTTIPDDPAKNKQLQTHLQSADFFDVREYPTAKFESSEISYADGGEATIKGNLTLHGQTKEISFPATVSVTDKGLTLHSDFSINRSEFGMTFGEGQVDDKVSLSVAIGANPLAP